MKKGNELLDRLRVYSLLRLLIRGVANITLPLYYVITSKNKLHKLTKTENKTLSYPRYIVSLTTFPARINKVWLVIETILRQKVKPDKIILWISKKQFEGIESLPNKLINQMKRGLEIRFVDEDIRSHKKYYYVMKEFPQEIIITIDDDILYRNDFIKFSVDFHKENPKDIISFYCRKVLRKNDELITYNKWPKTELRQKSISELFFGSGGGTLFPPNSLYNDLLNRNLFLKLTPIADDIWLNTMSRLNKTNIYSVSNKYHIPLPVINWNNKTLAKQNVSENLNDIQIKNVRNYYLENFNIDPFKI